MRFPNLISVAAAALIGLSTVNANVAFKRALINGPCTGAGGAPGVCISTSSCDFGGGVFISNACPGTPADVKCCVKTSCGNGGNCRFMNNCQGNPLSGVCPGPSTFKCCVPGTAGTGGGGGTAPTSPNVPKGGNNFLPPRIPMVGSCRQTSVTAAKKIVAAFPNKVREIGCIRACACGSGSDHCCGLALDLMNSLKAGVSY